MKKEKRKKKKKEEKDDAQSSARLAAGHVCAGFTSCLPSKLFNRPRLLTV
jgi:hypothetical protein